LNFNDAAIDKFKTDIKDEIVKALAPRFNGIDAKLEKIDGRLRIVEEHMGRHCKEIQKLESTINSNGRILRSHGRILRSQGKLLKSHDIALKKLIKEE
jgi:hypothetical protein